MMMRHHLLLIFCLYVFAPMARADEKKLYAELLLIGGYSRVDGWTGNRPALKNSAGMEYFHKFSNDFGDTWTLDLQVRLAYDTLAENGHAWGMEVHNAWLERRLGLGESIRFGHFDPPFGLEPVLDTHGTLLQTLARDNIGYKKDWGVGYRRLVGDYDLETALQIGSGMGLRWMDGSYLFSTRLSRAALNDLKYGISFLQGRTLSSRESWTIPKPELSSDQSIAKTRIGVDVQVPFRECRLLGEAAVGQNDGKIAGGAVAQIEYILPKLNSITLKMQGRYWSDQSLLGESRQLALTPAVEYILNSRSTIRLAYFHEFSALHGNEDRAFVLQFYYYGLGVG